MPSLFNDYGNLPKASFMNIGLRHEDLILQIAELGLEKTHSLPTFMSEKLDYNKSLSFQSVAV